MGATKLITELKQTGLYKDWVGEQKVISTEVDKYETVRTIVKDENDECYSLYRFFKIGDNWQVSADVNGLTAEDVAVNLLESINK